MGGKYRFIFGSSPAVTGRDWQEGNNVPLSGNIGKGGGYGQYRVVAVTGHDIQFVYWQVSWDQGC